MRRREDEEKQGGGERTEERRGWMWMKIIFKKSKSCEKRATGEEAEIQIKRGLKRCSRETRR